MHFEPLSVKRITNAHDSFSELFAILEHDDVNALVSLVPVNILLLSNVVVEEGQSLASRCAEDEFFKSYLLNGLNCACHLSD